MKELEILDIDSLVKEAEEEVKPAEVHHHEEDAQITYIPGEEIEEYYEEWEDIEEEEEEREKEDEEKVV